MSAAEMLAMRKEQLEAELAKTEKTVREREREISSSTKKEKKNFNLTSLSLSLLVPLLHYSLRRSTTSRPSTSPQSTATPGRF